MRLAARSWTFVFLALVAACANKAPPQPPAAPATAPSSAPASAPVTAHNELCEENFEFPNARCCSEAKDIDAERAFELAKQLGDDVQPFLFDNAVIATGGRIRVYRGAYEDIGRGTQFGLMTLDGKLAAPFEWDFVGFVCQGVGAACKGCKKDCGGHRECEHWRITGGTWSCIDADGKTVACPPGLLPTPARP